MSGADEVVDAREELVELLADLRAAVEQAALQGAQLFPREPFLDPAELPLAGWQPERGAASPEDRPSPSRARGGPRGGPRGAPATGPAGSSRTPSAPTPGSVPQRPAFQAPPQVSGARGRGQGRPPGAAAPSAGSQASPSEGGPGGKQASLGAWGRFRKPAAPVVASAGPVELPPGADLAKVREILGDCQRCGLCRGRRNIVFGVGDPRARLVVVGEAPGAQEDRQGEPFVGKAGQMLDRMVENVLGLQRSQIYIANVVKCRPPDNRNPEPEEVAACQPFLRAQLGAIEPDLVLVLGRVAAQTLFETGRGITSLRGQWKLLDLGGRKVPAMCTFHPAYLLRRPEEKRKTFEDLKALRARMDELTRS